MRLRRLLGLPIATVLGIFMHGCTVQASVGVAPACLFGVYAASRSRAGDEGEEAALTARERSLGGRRFDLDRIYHQWDDAVPGARERWTLGYGRTPVVSFNGRRGTGVAVTWRAIASGSEDAHLADVAEGFKALPGRALCAFAHEPDNDTPAFGGPADFQAAFRHVVDVFRAHHVTNVSWVFTMKSVSFANAATSYYPGDEVVDWIGVSAFNFGAGEPGGRWVSLRALLGDFHTWASPHGKPLVVMDWATVEDAADKARKPQWIEDAVATVNEWPDVRAMAYFDAAPPGSQALDSSAASLDAFRRIAGEPVFTVDRR